MNKKMLIAVLAAAVAIVSSGCASSPNAAASGQPSAASTPPPTYAQNEPQSQTAIASEEAKRNADTNRVLDWANRGLGEDASPAWLLPAIRGNFRVFKQDWQIREDKVLKVGVSRAPALNAAMTIADVQYAARLANQLKQAVVTKAAITLGSDDQFTVVNDAATKTKVSIAGQERLTDFWQLNETVDKNGRTVTAYNYYVVYACDPDVWSKLVAKYLLDVTGNVQDQRAKQTIAAMFNEIDAETRYEREKSDLEFAAEIRAQQAALEAPVAPTARREAYRSGDPARIAAASVTAADTDYIAALAALAGIE
jgi:type IV pilus biogenesis protein CpaD/CtpE